ncbi:MAG: hypothetical protein RLZZ67_274 [Candidatus Parcubacteria bacterium]|jgi:hypothetical protein
MKSVFFKFLFIIALSVIPFFASAGTQHNLSGYAWSSNIGWISFNCTNTGTCGTADYGVHKTADGRLCGNDTCSVPGYAWSSNVGWIQFGNLTSGFPVGTGTYTQDAQVVGGALRGWARVLSNGGGWDGWISFSGTSPAYGVTLSGTTFSGYAWGNAVMGWISFDAAGANGVKMIGDASLDVQNGGISIVNNGAVTYATIPTFLWTLTNISGSCAVTKTVGGSPFSTPITGKTTSGSQIEDALSVSGLHTYSIDCTNPTVSKQVSFTVAPQPQDYTLGSNQNMTIQILPTGTADSETKLVPVAPNAAFVTAANPVVIGISNYPPTIASTTFMYSLNGGTNYYAKGSGSLTSTIPTPYSASAGLRVRVTRVAGAPAFTGPYTIRLTGTSTNSNLVRTVDVTLNPANFDPRYQEF